MAKLMLCYESLIRIVHFFNVKSKQFTSATINLDVNPFLVFVLSATAVFVVVEVVVVATAAVVVVVMFG